MTSLSLLESPYNLFTKFLNKSICTIDSYGVGIALLYVLNRTGKFLDVELFKNLRFLYR